MDRSHVLDHPTLGTVAANDTRVGLRWLPHGADDTQGAWYAERHPL